MGRRLQSTILALGATLFLNGASCNSPPPVTVPPAYVIPAEVPGEYQDRLELIADHFRHNQLQKVFIQYRDRRMRFQYGGGSMVIDVSDRNDERFPNRPSFVTIIDDWDEQGRFGIADVIIYTERSGDDYVQRSESELDSVRLTAALEIEYAVAETIAGAIVRGDMVVYDHGTILFNVDTTRPNHYFDGALERLLPNTAVTMPDSEQNRPTYERSGTP